jgi:hypothetical protein
MPGTFGPSNHARVTRLGCIQACFSGDNCDIDVNFLHLQGQTLHCSQSVKDRPAASLLSLFGEEVQDTCMQGVFEIIWRSESGNVSSCNHADIELPQNRAHLNLNGEPALQTFPCDVPRQVKRTALLDCRLQAVSYAPGSWVLLTGG